MQCIVNIVGQRYEKKKNMIIQWALSQKINQYHYFPLLRPSNNVKLIKFKKLHNIRRSQLKN